MRKSRQKQRKVLTVNDAEQLKEDMGEAADKIINILSDYDFNTMQARLLLNRVGKSITEAQAEETGKEIVPDAEED